MFALLDDVCSAGDFRHAAAAAVAHMCRPSGGQG